jgi:hypothetical protein
VKGLGYWLISGGFLVGSYFTVRHAEGVPWPWYLMAFLAGLIGVVMVRRATHGEARQADRIATNLDAIGSSLEAAVEKARALDRDKGEIDVYELRHHIDREFPQHLDAFVQARESISHRFGLHAYAEVMNPFAAGERHLNRVWSASTDGYIDEAHTYIGRALEQLEQALAVFRVRDHHRAS